MALKLSNRIITKGKFFIRSLMGADTPPPSLPEELRWASKPGSIGTFKPGDVVNFALPVYDPTGTADTWEITAGSLPEDIQMNPYTGRIEGTVPTVGTTTYTFTVQVSDLTPKTITGVWSITVENSAPTVEWVTPQDGLSDADVGGSVYQRLEAKSR